MPRNRLQRLVPSKLASLARIMATELGPTAPNRYSVAQSLLDEIHDAIAGQDEALDALRQAETAYHAAVAAHKASRAALSSSAARIANVCYAAPGVTANMIVALGLSPRTEARTSVRPSPVTRLFATPQAPHDVLIEFDRGENGESVNFIVESRLGSEPWTFITSLRSTRLRLPGLGRPQERSFRVTASVNGQCAAPSNVATIFRAEDARRAA